ncbi:hypothetical protein Y032_0287g1449 [Ancylostoma ceylanicum]|uniref:Uncharacterized protein n=1 Tax=Ancylostoma ceylanicum TaxID=53326 RepID=A0A016S6A5_9BILA|nr:hypothetical protein Y032_0287g1449 [Ancylostoma ceylanicum]
MTEVLCNEHHHCKKNFDNANKFITLFFSINQIGRLVYYLIQLQILSPVGNKLYYDRRLIESQRQTEFLPSYPNKSKLKLIQR